MKQSRIPKRGEVVRAEGHTGEFIVLRVHKREGEADLGLTGADSVEYRVPFGALQVIREDFSQAAARSKAFSG